MSQSPVHPSYLELDRHGLGVSSPETTEHVARCAQCRQHVDAITAGAAPPVGLVQLVGPRRTHGRAAGIAFSALAVAAALCLALLRREPSAPEYDGVKGAPSIAVHVNRAGHVALWDHAPLLPGDRIRLEVAPDEFEYVSVFARQSGERLTALYTGRVPTYKPTLLPKAWQLDASPEPEQLLVMFSHAQISEQAARALLQARDPKDVWVVQLNLPKAAR